MPWVAAVAAVAAPVIGGIIGQQNSAADRDAARQAANEAFQQINAIGAPPDQAKAIILEKFKQAGLYTPELEQKLSAGISQVSQIQEDPTLRNAQMGALTQLQQRATNGLNASDRQALNEERSQVANDTTGRLGSIQQNMAARGQAGGGAELAASLQAVQAGQNAEGAASDRIAAQAQQAALQAAMNSGQLGGSIRSQDFGVNQAKASAADQFKLFDTQNSLAQQQRNVSAQNQAQQQNLANAQNISNQNTSNANNELYRQSAAQEQYWNDQAKLAGMKSNARLGQASNLQNQANASAQAAQNMGSGVGSAAGSIFGYLSKNGNSTNPSTNTGSYAPSATGDGSTTSALGDYSTPQSGTGNIFGVQTKAYGGMIEGKDLAPGDDPKNDTVPALLSPGEVVIPKTVVDHGPDAAYGFLHALINKHKRVK